MAQYKDSGRVMYSKKDYTWEDIQEAYRQMIKLLDKMPNSELTRSAIYVTIRKVTANGMGRYMSFHINQFNDETGNITLVDVTYWIARILEESVYHEGGGSIYVKGAGMDMRFHIIDNFFMAMNTLAGVKNTQDNDQKWTKDYSIIGI
tara:strand:- start:2683 stop:3126 length:444 start_codon:yes stop_codon:yes gene_type:complete